MSGERRNEIAERIGRALRAAREERGLTQADVAAAMRVDRSTVTAWETGKRLPDFPTLSDLAKLLGLPLDRLLSRHGPAAADPTPEDRLRMLRANLRALGATEADVRIIMALLDARRKELQARLAAGERGTTDGEAEPQGAP